MDRARFVAALALPLVIVVGAAGAWAVNPDSGAVLHDGVLWHVFGGMFEIGMFLSVISVMLLGVYMVCRKLLSLRSRAS